jgi:hypothetical protein
MAVEVTRQADVTASPPPTTSRRARVVATSVLLVGYLLFWKTIGLPTDPTLIFAWLWAATIAWNIRAPLRFHLGFARDWLPVIAVIVAYQFSRGIADNLGVPLHVTEPIRFDEALTGGTLPTIWAQQHLCATFCTSATPARWYDVVAAFVYFSHFVTALIVAMVLWVRSRRLWASFMRRFIGLDLLGLAIYIAYPMAPPWWAAEHGYLPHVDRITDRGWDLIGLHSAGQLVTRGQAVSNPVAAMPSLHTAFATLVAVFAITHLRTRWRWLLLLYPVAMGATLVYTGEHYVLDLFAGVVVTAVVLLTVSAGERWWARRGER